MHSKKIIKITQRESGFTLAEVVVTVGIFAVIITGVTLLFKDVYTNSVQQQKSLSNSDQARAVAQRFVNEIRNVAYGVDGSYPLNQAGDNQIVFFTTYGGNGTVYRVRYYVSGTTLYKGVIAPSGNPLDYNGGEIITAVEQNIANGATPMFYYYDGTYSGSGTPLTQQINVTVPKFAQINMIVLTQNQANSTSTFTVKDGALMRNLKTNLGN